MTACELSAIWNTASGTEQKSADPMETWGSKAVGVSSGGVPPYGPPRGGPFSFVNLAIMEREARHGESCKHVKKGKSRESSKKSKSQTATRRSSN